MSDDRKVLGYVVKIFYPMATYSTSKDVHFDAQWESLAQSMFEHLKSQGVSVWFSTLREPIELDYTQIADVELDGINTRDYPDFCDAFVASASYMGREMTDDELDTLNEDRDYVYEKTIGTVF